MADQTPLEAFDAVCRLMEDYPRLLCDSTCEGRCRMCPNDTLANLHSHREAIRRALADSERIAQLEAELKAARVDAERWHRLCNLWAASTELLLRQDEEGTWSIRQLESVENETFPPLVGADPDAAIDRAREGGKDG